MKTKTQIAKTIFFATVVATVFSCTKKDDAVNTNLNSLAPVKYENRPDTEKSATTTGKTVVDPTSGKILTEYLVTTEKAAVFSKAALMKENNIENTVLYPGSILRGSSYIDGAYDPLVLTNPFKPVTLFIDIKGADVNGADKIRVAIDNVLPKGSTIFSAISELGLGNKDKFPKEYIPGNYSFESTEINNSESLIKSIGLHVKANYGKLASGTFNYDYNTTDTKKDKYIMMKLTQVVYSAGIDPVAQANWIEGGINAQECGTHEPVYISSVDYGRVAYLMIKTDKTTADMSKIVSASIKVGIGKFGASADYTDSQIFKALFDSSSITVTVLGGPSAIVTTYDQFISYMQLADSPDQLLATSKPIGYTVRRMKDNTTVDFINYYKDVKKEFR
jgi:thiol-activated cytolysin